MKCVVCGMEQILRVQCADGGRHTYEPPVERQPRLSIEVLELFKPDGSPWFDAAVCLDGTTLQSFEGDTEPEARAPAQKYVVELIAHFRAGGR